MKINPLFLATIRNDTRSFCERTVIEDFLRLCDIPGTSPQWCIDEIQRNSNLFTITGIALRSEF